MKRRLISQFVLALGLSLGVAGISAHADDAKQFHEGLEYKRLLVPQPVSPAGKVVVTEFFWYDCPHCSALEPLLEAWAKKLPANVVLERVPVAFAPQYVAQQRLYYALQAMGKVDGLQGAIFNAIHAKHIPLNNEEQMANWVAQHGVDKKTFTNTFNSFSVDAKVKQATQMMADYQIQGVPTIAVQGLYTTSASMPEAGSNEKVLQVVDALIQKVSQGK